MKDNLDEFKLTVQQVYARFCQADYSCIDRAIEKLTKFGQLALDCSLNISEVETIIKVCDLYVARMRYIILVAELISEDKKRDIIISQGLQFVNALKELKANAKQIMGV